MHCVSCGAASRYNRAVQHTERGLVGTLCGDCEGRVFGEGLNATSHTAAGTCHLCEERPVVALPEHQLYVDGREDLDLGGYFLSSGTPMLCQAHAPPGVAEAAQSPEPDEPPVLVEG
jgi:hypothetical protein